MPSQRAPSSSLALVIVCALSAASSGCGGPGLQPIPVTVSRYDALAPLSLAEFVHAREMLEHGDVNDASAAFEHLFVRLPDNILVGTWLQEAQIVASPPVESADAHATALPQPNPTQSKPTQSNSTQSNSTQSNSTQANSTQQSPITDLWTRRAAEHPTVANYVLAARVAATREEAAALLDSAGALDSECAWVPYGKGWLAARDAEWPAAREEIARAKAADPGHVWTYWLEAWMTTRTGAIADAAADLEVFLDRARDDPRIAPQIVSESQLDLALLWTLQGNAKDARALIQKIDPNSVGAARRLLALASVNQALEKLAPALAAAEEAEKVAPGQVMPVLQQALLYDDWLDEPEKAGAAWKRVLDMARSSSDLSAVLERTRAGVRLERYQLAHPKSATEAATDAGSAPERP